MNNRETGGGTGNRTVKYVTLSKRSVNDLTKRGGGAHAVRLPGRDAAGIVARLREAVRVRDSERPVNDLTRRGAFGPEGALARDVRVTARTG